MKIKTGRDVLVFKIFSYIITTIFGLLCIIPFYLIVVGSLTDESTIIKEGYQFFLTAKTFSLEAYKMALKNPESILHAYGVTIFVTVVGTTLSIIITTMTGYVLARPDFPWRNALSFFFFFTTLFNGGLVPWYLLCTNTFKFTNHMYALIIPGLFSVWNMIIAKSFMKGIPIATLTLFIALSYWNDWYNCMLFMSTGENWNLQYTLQNILNSSEALKRVAAATGMQIGQMPSEGLKLAMTVIATGPIVFLYPFLQKYFVKGLTIGAVKG